jgi:hypothetical protein
MTVAWITAPSGGTPAGRADRGREGHRLVEPYEIAAGHADLLAEVAGLLLGAREGLLGAREGELDEPQVQAAAQLCIAARADADLISQ